MLMAQRYLSFLPRAARPFAVNIGCGSGIDCCDPVYPLFVAGWEGIAIDAARQPDLPANLGHLPVKLLDETPVRCVGVRDVLQAAGCPDEFDLLKVDIDGIDGPLTASILQAGALPRLIQIEVNCEVPPPVAFTVYDHDEYRAGSETGFYGCSLAWAVDMLRRFDYVLVEVDFLTPWTHDALFAHRALGFGALATRGAFRGQRALLPHLNNIPIERRFQWRNEQDGDMLTNEIAHAMAQANVAKHGHGRVGFDCLIARG